MSPKPVCGRRRDDSAVVTVNGDFSPTTIVQFQPHCSRVVSHTQQANLPAICWYSERPPCMTRAGTVSIS
jgi:hypothetical protein